jgi:hypothetical protein
VSASPAGAEPASAPTPPLRDRLALMRDELLTRLETRVDRSDIALLADVVTVLGALPAGPGA